MKKTSKLEQLQGVLVTADDEGRITLPYGRPNWRYRAVVYDDGAIVLEPLGPKED